MVMAKDGSKNWIKCTMFDSYDNQCITFDCYNEHWRALQKDWRKVEKGPLDNCG